MKLVWHPLAEDELNDVAAYYRRQDGPELALAFLNEAERVAALIAKRPAAGRALRDGIRCWRLRSYPYAIVYRAKADHVRLLAVAGERRRPFYWRGRS